MKNLKPTLAYGLTASAWILISDFTLRSLVEDVDRFYRIGLAKGLIFVGVTSILLYAYLHVRGDGARPVGRAWVATPAFLLALLAFTGSITTYVAVYREQAIQIALAQQTLETMANLRVAQLEAWLEQRKSDAAHVAARLPQPRENAEGRRAETANLLAAIGELGPNLGAATLSTDCTLRTSVAIAAPLSEASLHACRSAQARAQPAHSDFQRLREGEPASIDFIVPVGAQAGSGRAFLLLRANAEDTILPRIAAWPTQDPSGEVLLVERADDRIRYITPLRHRAGPALGFEMPADRLQLPAVHAIAGLNGVYDGLDYRGVEVTSALRPVGDGRWGLVAKQDRASILEPLAERAAFSALGMLLLIVGAGAAIAAVWRARAQSVELEARRASLEKQLLAQRLDLLSRHANDILLVADREHRIVEANDRAFEAYGMPRERLVGLPLEQLRAPESSDALTQALAEGAPGEGKVFETAQRRADGGTFPIEASLRTVDLGGTRSHLLLIRDITERKQAERHLHRLASLYDALSQTNGTIIRVTDREELFREACRIAVEAAGLRYATVWRIEHEAGRLVRVATHAADGSPSGPDTLEFAADAPDGHAPPAVCAREDRTVVEQVSCPATGASPWQAAAEAAAVREVAALPVREAGRIVAVLALCAGETGYFDGKAGSTVREMARDISFALDKITALDTLEAAREVLESSPAVLFRWKPGPGWPVEFVSENVTQFGFSRQRFVDEGLPFAKAVHPQDLGRIEGEVAAHVAAGRDHFEQTYRLVTPDGRTLWVEDLTTVVRGDDGAPVRYQGVLTDVSARHETEEKLRAVLEQTLAGIYMIEDGRFTYVNPRMAEIFGYGPDEIESKSVESLVAPEDRALVKENIRRRIDGEVRSVQYAFHGLRKDGSRIDVGVHGAVAEIGARRSIVGLVQDITEKRLAEERIRDTVARLERAMLGTVDAISHMVELRDPYTSGHERRVGELAAAIGVELGLDEATVQGLRIAGWMHDIGKITVPAEILAKPTRLSPPEFEIVRTHAAQGYEILKNVDFPWPVARVAHEHHERIDGTGYPRGLKGDEIALEARIVAVADVLEAMGTHRPYRPAIGLDKALAEIEAGMGTRYDAAAAAACLRLFREKDYALPA